MFETINNYINKCSYFSEDEAEYFNSLLVPKTVSKKTLLLQEGEICNFEAYIVKGCIRSYYINENGFGVTLQFAIEDWWVSDITSFHDKKPSSLYIETLEECDLLTLTLEGKEQLLAENPKFERVFSRPSISI